MTRMRRTIWITVRLLKFNYSIPYSQLLEWFLVDNGVVETPHALQVGRLPADIDEHSNWANLVTSIEERYASGSGTTHRIAEGNHRNEHLDIGPTIAAAIDRLPFVASSLQGHISQFVQHSDSYHNSTSESLDKLLNRLQQRASYWERQYSTLLKELLLWNSPWRWFQSQSLQISFQRDFLQSDAIRGPGKPISDDTKCNPLSDAQSNSIPWCVERGARLERQPQCDVDQVIFTDCGAAPTRSVPLSARKCIALPFPSLPTASLGQGNYTHYQHWNICGSATPAMDSSQNTSSSPDRRHGQNSSVGGRDDPAEFYKRKISALEDTLNRREEDRKAKKM